MALRDVGNGLGGLWWSVLVLSSHSGATILLLTELGATRRSAE